MAILRVKQGPNEGKLYELKKNPLILGREPGDGIAIPDNGVSRRHAEIVPIGEVYFIRDLESRNGTFVNEESIQEEILRYGDRIRVGNTLLMFEDRLAYLKDTSRLIRESSLGTLNPSSTIQFRLPTGKAPPLKDALPAEESIEKRNLNVLFHIAHLINEESDLNLLHHRIAEVIGGNVEADHTYIFWQRSSETEQFEIIGRHDAVEASKSFSGVSRTIIRDCILHNRAILTADAAFDAQYGAMESVVSQQIHSVICAPIPVLGESRGVLYLHSHKPEAFSAEDLELASVIGIQLGTTIGLLKAVRKADGFFRNSIQALVSASEMRSPESRGKCERVATYSLAMAKELAFSTNDLRNAWLAGMLHDVGLVPMTDNERQQEVTLETKKNHYARLILQEIPTLTDVLPAVENQGEYFDGSGAPEGKKGDEIPLVARILSVAKDFDDLLYGVTQIGEEMSIKEALLKISDEGGKQYDPKVVNAMLIAYRKGRLMNADEEFFELPL